MDTFMGTWTLVVYLYGGFSGGPQTVIPDFQSLKLCEAAKKEFVVKFGSGLREAICVQTH